MRKHERKKKRRFAHLTLTERLQMEAWLKTKTSVKQIAEMLHKDQSTIYREIKRGGYDRLNGEDYSVYRAYSPDIAEGRYRENLKAKGAPLKLGSDREYAEYIEEKILKDCLDDDIAHKYYLLTVTFVLKTYRTYLEW